MGSTHVFTGAYEVMLFASCGKNQLDFTSNSIASLPQNGLSSTSGCHITSHEKLHQNMGKTHATRWPVNSATLRTTGKHATESCQKIAWAVVANQRLYALQHWPRQPVAHLKQLLATLTPAPRRRFGMQEHALHCFQSINAIAHTKPIGALAR
jgi:hypothetical protein